MKCDHNSCQVDAYSKPIPAAKQEPATMEVRGYIDGRTLYRCQKHFEAFDLLHQAVLAVEGTLAGNTVWNPKDVSYHKEE